MSTTYTSIAGLQKGNFVLFNGAVMLVTENAKRSGNSALLYTAKCELYANGTADADTIEDLKTYGFFQGSPSRSLSVIDAATAEEIKTKDIK